MRAKCLGCPTLTRPHLPLPRERGLVPVAIVETASIVPRGFAARRRRRLVAAGSAAARLLLGRLPPPGQAHFPRLVHGSDQEADLNAQQLDVAKLDLDVAGNDHALVQHPLEDVGQAFGVAGGGQHLRVCHGAMSFQRSVPSGPRSRLRSSSLRPNSCLSRSISSESRRKVRPSRSISSARQRAAVDPPQRLPLQQFAQQLDQRQHQADQSVADVVGIEADVARGAAVGEGSALKNVVALLVQGSLLAGAWLAFRPGPQEVGRPKTCLSPSAVVSTGQSHVADAKIGTVPLPAVPMGSGGEPSRLAGPSPPS